MSHWASVQFSLITRFLSESFITDFFQMELEGPQRMLLSNKDLSNVEGATIVQQSHSSNFGPWVHAPLGYFEIDSSVTITQ